MQQWVIEKCNDEGRQLVWQTYSNILCGKKRGEMQFRDQSATYHQRLAQDTDDLSGVPGVKLGQLIRPQVMSNR
jgi:hypothetical protein